MSTSQLRLSTQRKIRKHVAMFKSYRRVAIMAARDGDNTEFWSAKAKHHIDTAHKIKADAFRRKAVTL